MHVYVISGAGGTNRAIVDAVRSGSKSLAGDDDDDHIEAAVFRQAVLGLYRGGQIVTTPQDVRTLFEEWELDAPSEAELARADSNGKDEAGKLGGMHSSCAVSHVHTR